MRRQPRRGFTLIEAALTTVIIGVGVMSMLQLLAAGSIANATATDSTMGMNLATNIRELTANLAFADPRTGVTEAWGRESGETVATFNDVWDFDGWSSSAAGPVDARRALIPDMVNWRQSVALESLDPNGLTTPMPKGTTKVAMVTCTITHNNKTAYQMRWMVVDPN